MKLLIIGAGGVGTSAAKIIARAGADGDWAEKVVVADYDLERAKKVANEITVREEMKEEKTDPVCNPFLFSLLL